MEIEITLTIDGTEQEYSLCFDGTLYDFEIGSMETLDGQDADHLIEPYQCDIDEEIMNYFVGQADYQAEQQFELERGN